MSSLIAKSFKALKSSSAIPVALTPIAAMPELPGAQKTSATCGLFFKARATANSRPPDPTTKIFSLSFIFY
ncbi:hypothetical protein G134_1603 [Lactobacillus delbrueckii subsp. lactis CRL581]|nr:hypothetical protein G134_1603 [Lactobacillus delbrueckii subsp. lactis CRL581]